MTEVEYKEIQARLTAKLKDRRYPTNKEHAYNEGILSAKSVIKSIYIRSVYEESKKNGVK